MQNESEDIRSQIKENIQVLIENNQLNDADILVDEYFKISNNDLEAYSIKSVILMLKGQIDEAENLLLNALKYNNYEFDLNYNLGYIYFNKKEYELSLQYYKKAYMSTYNNETKENIKAIIKEMLYELNSNDEIEVFLKREIVKNENIKSQSCLILCHFYSVYTKEFLEKIYNKTNVKFDILTIDSSYKEKVRSGIIENVYIYNDLNKMNEILNSKEQYDIIHIHFLTPFYGEVAEQIRSKCKKLIITIWGSDFYRTTTEQKEQQRKLVNKADIITFDNDVTMDDFAEYYEIVNKEKLSINRFGLTALEYIRDLENIDSNQIKAEYNIPENSIVITCGYNANSAHNHLEIIKSIKQIKNKLPENMYYIFPMTYSRDEKYCDIVKEELSKSGLKYIVLEEFMNFGQMAKLTKITDIMIQVQTTDTLSATMQEHMYHGNIIITGSWLPYKPLKKVGAYFFEVFSVDRIGKKLINAAQELTEIKQRCKKNKNVIWNFSAWENTVESWIGIYNKEVNIQLSEFNHAIYWDYRYGNKFDLESSGTMGLGITYNKYLYKSRLDVLDYLNKHLLGNISDKKVLELGTGTGYFTNYFNEQNIESYYGIDISQKSIDNLSSIYKNFKFKCGDISDGTIYEPNKTYNLIFASDVLLHLTNDEKFQKSIHNISSVLNDDGYFIDIEPITMSGVETSSPHNRIIKYEEFKAALEKENLEIVDTIPVTFFMDYPFDYKVMGIIGEKALSTFNEVVAYLQDDSHTSEEKEKIVEKIYYFDKCFLKYYKKGLSNKLTIVKKKANPNVYKAVIENIWSNNEFSILNDFEKFNISTLINKFDEEWVDNQKFEEPLITVAIINYNYSRYIDECINSILNQNYNNIDILIIDDCSNKDDSIEKIKEYTRKYKNIRAIYHEFNKGLTTGLRDAIQYANGKYLIPISADDYFYTRSALRELSYIMEKEATVNYVHCNLVNVNEECKYRGSWKYKQYTTEEMVCNTFNNMGVAIVPSTAGMYRVEFFRRNKITWYEDKELGIDGDDGINSLYFAKHDWNYKYIDSGLIAYRQHNNNMSFNFEIRINYLISAIEFIACNFNEKIYLPHISWGKFTEQERMAIKMFKIGEKYSEMFMAHYNDSVKPWREIQFSFSENYLVFKNIFKYVKLYFNKSIKFDDLLKDNIESILSKIDRCFNDINNS